MAGYGDMLKKSAYGVGDQWSRTYDAAMGNNNYQGTNSNIMSGASADPSRGGGGKFGAGPGFSQFMDMAQAPDMSRPQMQGQDIVSLIQMLQGGQQPRGGRNARW